MASHVLIPACTASSTAASYRPASSALVAARQNCSPLVKYWRACGRSARTSLPLLAKRLGLRRQDPDSLLGNLRPECAPGATMNSFAERLRAQVHAQVIAEAALHL